MVLKAIIVAGTVLANAVTYIVYEQAVYITTTYYSGQTITGNGTALISGIVILSSVVVDCDLPVNMHEEVCKLSAAILEGTVESFSKEQDLNIQAEKS